MAIKEKSYNKPLVLRKDISGRSLFIVGNDEIQVLIKIYKNKTIDMYVVLELLYYGCVYCCNKQML